MTDRIDTAKEREGWMTWVDDLPLPCEFNNGQDKLQEYIAKLCDALDAKDAEIERLRAERSDFDRADWFWRDLDPDDSGDSAHEAIDMLPDFMVSCVCSSFSGPTRYVFRAPVLGTDSDDTEVLHFDTEEEALAAATARAALNLEGETTSGSSKWGPQFPPASCTAYEDCAHDGVCHDPNCGAPSQHGKGEA